MKKLIILDRDGVINHDSENYIKSPDEWQAIDGSMQAIANLKDYGYKVAIATNQSGIGRGLYSEEIYRAIEKKMINLLSNYSTNIDCIEYCPHIPEDDCLCRKPKPGMLNKIMGYLDIKPEHTIFVGDSYRDMQAARLANCKPILVLTGNGKKTLKNNKSNLDNIDIYNDLKEFYYGVTGKNDT